MDNQDVYDMLSMKYEIHNLEQEFTRNFVKLNNTHMKVIAYSYHNIMLEGISGYKKTFEVKGCQSVLQFIYQLQHTYRFQSKVYCGFNEQKTHTFDRLICISSKLIREPNLTFTELLVKVTDKMLESTKDFIWPEEITIFFEVALEVNG